MWWNGIHSVFVVVKINEISKKDEKKNLNKVNFIPLTTVYSVVELCTK